MADSPPSVPETGPIDLIVLMTKMAGIFKSDPKHPKTNEEKAQSLVDLVDEYGMSRFVETSRTYPFINVLVLNTLVTTTKASDFKNANSADNERLALSINEALQSVTYKGLPIGLSFPKLTPDMVPGIRSMAGVALDEIGIDKIAEEFFKQTPPKELAAYIVQNANADQASVMLRRAISYNRLDHFDAILDAVENGVDGKKPAYSVKDILQSRADGGMVDYVTFVSGADDKPQEGKPGLNYPDKVLERLHREGIDITSIAITALQMNKPEIAQKVVDLQGNDIENLQGKMQSRWSVITANTSKKTLDWILKPERGVDIDYVAEQVKDNADLTEYVAKIKAERQPAPPLPAPPAPEAVTPASATGTQASLLLLPMKIGVDADALPDGMDAEKAADALRAALQGNLVSERTVTSVNPDGYAPLTASALLANKPSALGGSPQANIDAHAGNANYKLAMSVEKDKDGNNFISVFLTEPDGFKNNKAPTRIYYAAVDPEYPNETMRALLTAGTPENKQFTDAVTKSLAVAFDDPAAANKQWGTDAQAFQLIDREAVEQSSASKYLAALKAAGVGLVGTAGFAVTEISGTVRDKVQTAFASARTSIETALASNQITPDAAEYLQKDPSALAGLSLDDIKQLPAALADKSSELYKRLAEKVSAAGLTLTAAVAPTREPEIISAAVTETDAGKRPIVEKDQLLKIAKEDQAKLSKIAEEAGLSALVSDKDKAAMARWAYVFATAHENGFKTAKEANNLVAGTSLDLPEEADIKAAAEAMKKLLDEKKKITYAAMEEILPPVTPVQTASVERTPE